MPLAELEEAALIIAESERLRRYSFRYSCRKDVPWWKFWVRGKWTVYRVDQPGYALPGMNKAYAMLYVETINQMSE